MPPVAPGNSHCELRKLADLALDFHCPSVLLRHDLIADRKTEARASARWLGREERLEQLVLNVGGNADQIIPNTEFNCVPKISRPDLQDGSEARLTTFLLPFCCGIKPI